MPDYTKKNVSELNDSAPEVLQDFWAPEES